MRQDFGSLLFIMVIAAFVPLVVGLLRIRVAEVVLLLGVGVLFGPQMLGFIHITQSIEVFAELGMGLLFFVAGMEIDKRAVTGTGGRLAAVSWGVALLLAGLFTGALSMLGVVQDFVGVSIALTTTALGTLLPILRDAGELGSPFGRLFLGAGAWGELGPIVAIAILLGSKSTAASLLFFAIFLVVAALTLVVPARLRLPAVTAIIDRGNHTSSQTAVRLIMLLLVTLLVVAGAFGIDAVLGAFIAGIIARRLAPLEEGSALLHKVDAIAFGFFIPLFFVVSGARLDVHSIVAGPLKMLVFFVLLFVVRGLPQMVIYRSVIPDRVTRWRFSFLVATGLPLLVAITSLEVSRQVMRPDTGAAIVGAGALSVLVFPLAAAALGRRRPQSVVVNA
ncbi:MAG: cation:proton antiporter [Candidatus Nanopelagicales bacterium]|nr:cation:proton antiporter [Candidatus Nanopelagicales bacterium]